MSEEADLRDQQKRYLKSMPSDHSSRAPGFRECSNWEKTAQLWLLDAPVPVLTGSEATAAEGTRAYPSSLWDSHSPEPTLPIHRGETCISENPRHNESESKSCSVLSHSLWPHGYTVHGTLQARILEWIAFPFFRVSSQPRDPTQVSPIPGRFFTRWATREALRHNWRSLHFYDKSGSGKSKAAALLVAQEAVTRAQSYTSQSVAQGSATHKHKQRHLW